MIINIIGAGLAGSEAACYLSKRGHKIILYDIKPKAFTPAHRNPNFGELVCSNSLKSDAIYENACGLLKEELLQLGSHLLKWAKDVRVPAGAAWAVDRDLFAKKITQSIKNNDNIEIKCEEVTKIDFNIPTIIATGPLTTDKFSEFIKDNFSNGLYFYDAVAPIISAESINMDQAFVSDRYGGIGQGDYINCPISKEGYLNFYNELITAKQAEKHNFEDLKVFEGCMPIEIMAKRGVDTLRFGPLKPAGLTDPKTGRWPYACMQLRAESVNKKMYNIVGFQTNLLWSEQKRVFSIFPALKNAEFLRYGVMHRNTFINGPATLEKDFSVKGKPYIFFAGQITGVEGYVESIGSGLISAINLDRKLAGKDVIDFTPKTIIGALANYCSTPTDNFQPMNANYGILAQLEKIERNKKERKRLLSERSLKQIKIIKELL